MCAQLQLQPVWIECYDAAGDRSRPTGGSGLDDEAAFAISEKSIGAHMISTFIMGPFLWGGRHGSRPSLPS